MGKALGILIAEDDDGHYTLIKRYLERMGFQSNVTRFKDGQEILDFLTSHQAKTNRMQGKNYLAILDIRMPKVSGIDVLKFLKATQDYKDIPVVMLTSSDDTYEIAKCLMLGCDDYILKPTEFRGFAKTMKQVSDSLISSMIDIVDLNNSHNRVNHPDSYHNSN